MKNLKKNVLSQEYEDTARSIFIGNLNKETTIDHLKEYFEEEKIEDCRLLKDN